MIRLLIVEDESGVRRGLQMLIDAEPGMSVIGEAMDDAAALDLTTSLHPDIVLIDLDSSRLDGIATARSLHSACPQIAVIILSFQENAPTRRIAADAGVATFVTKYMPVATLLAAIRQVAQKKLDQGKGEHGTKPV
jgi:DNA-binding NarL/FixJ family response regulator